jgi:Flp pilus assembly protein TadG
VTKLFPSIRHNAGQSSQARNRGAAAVVEFALVVPLVLMLAFAAIEFARVIMIRHSVDNAVYESARLAIIPGGTAAEARSETERLFSIIGISDFLVDVVPAVLTAETPEVTVRITVPLDSNSYFPQRFFAGRTIRRELTMRREGL